MRYAVSLCCLALAGVLAGCPSPQESLGPDPKAYTAGLSGEDPNSRRIPFIRVALVNLPKGAASDDEAIWARLSDDRIDPALRETLRRNGLRAATCRQQGLLDLIGAIQALTGRNIVYGMIPAVARGPKIITLKDQQPPRTIFTVDADGSTHGLDCPLGDYLLAVEGRLNPNAPSRVLLTVVPQVRSAVADAQLVWTEEYVGFSSNHPVVGFEDLTVTVPMPVGDVLVLGPARTSRRPTSVGHCFLTGDKDGMPFELIILLIPGVVTPTVP